MGVRRGMVLLLAWSIVSGSLAWANAPTMTRLFTRQEGASIDFYIENLTLADLTVTFEMEIENLDSAVSFPYTASFAPSSTTKAFRLTHQDTSKQWRWKYTYYSTWGRIEVTPETDHVYQLPYATGQAFKVSQGFHGRHSHRGADEYAIDWRMPEGTPVHAARGGVVVAVRDDSNRGGPEKQYDWDANFILIRHSDGTYGHYAHLMKGSALVEEGDRVEAGDFLALSGNTGFSTGPHLHFSVFRGKSGKARETLPIRYATARGVATLREGRSYEGRSFSVTANLPARK